MEVPGYTGAVSRRWLVLLVFAGACGSDGFELTVDAKTDLVAGREMAGIAYRLTRDGELVFEDEQLTRSGVDYVDGVRLAELEGLAAGTYALRVTAVGLDGSAVQAQTFSVALRGDYALTALLARVCNDTVCAPDEICFGGRCVDDECTPETIDACGEVCASAADCPSSGVECGQALCVDGACLERLDDTLCVVGAVCTEGGCAGGMPDAGMDTNPPDMGPADTGAPDTGSPDTGPPDTGPLPCDPVDCDDGEPCTDDRCELGSCIHEANTASCDDGFFCNGADTCADRTCSVHEGSPCARFCNESSDTCESCAGDDDCGEAVIGDFGGCDYDDVCDQSAVRRRTITTPRCETGTCVPRDEIDTEACDRITTDIRCDATTRTPYSECFFADCQTNGLRMRRRDERLCRGGSCQIVAFSESEACTRGSQEHQVCGGSTSLRCCGATCVNTATSTSHCGGCGLSCADGEGCGMRDGLSSCECAAGFNSLCAGSTGSCSGMSRLCSCDSRFGGSCPASMTCTALPAGADICVY